MEIISFHLMGKMAHFRKYYSNSSSLSYFIPPRTTICGMIAGLLGLERDSYYDDFSVDNFKVAVSSQRPIKKTMQKVNYLLVEKPNDLNGYQEHHSQTPIELVIPQNIREDCIDYKIWVYHKDKEIMGKMKELFNDNVQSYYKSYNISIALGTAFNLGWIENINILEGEEIFKENEAIISSVMPADKVKDIQTESLTGYKKRIIKEELPIEFDAKRRITHRGLKDIIANIDGVNIIAAVDSYVALEDGQNIMWME